MCLINHCQDIGWICPGSLQNGTITDNPQFPLVIPLFEFDPTERAFRPTEAYLGELLAALDILVRTNQLKRYVDSIVQ